MGSKHRLFIALPLSPEDSQSLNEQYEYLTGFNSILKVVPTGNYHITIKFLGDVQDNIFENLVSSYSKLNFETGRIKFILKGLGAFPVLKRANVFWCGMDTELEKIKNIKKEIEKFSSGFGFDTDKRDFKPHLTLARARKERIIPGKLIDYFTANREKIFGESFFQQVTLYESELTQAGPIYKSLHSIKLD